MYQNTDASPVVMAFGGVEMALWDLVGKLEGRSIASLLGGRVRDEIAFTEYFAMRESSGKRGGEQTPLEVARYCAGLAQDRGATAFEGKVGVRDLATEVAMVREVRNAVGPDAVLRLDANMAWTTTTARDALHRFEAFDLSSFEEPVRTHVELARLRSSTSVSFSTHNPNLREAVLLGVPDAFVINLTSLGGIRRTAAFIAACEEMRIDVWFYSDPGVATAAYLQVAAAMPWLSHPSQTLGRWLADDVISEGPLVPENGTIPVPDGPGLGVHLDPAAVRRCNERFANEGPYDDYLDPLVRTSYTH
jgi:glucarate dehydratase